MINLESGTLFIKAEDGTLCKLGDVSETKEFEFDTTEKSEIPQVLRIAVPTEATFTVQISNKQLLNFLTPASRMACALLQVISKNNTLWRLTKKSKKYRVRKKNAKRLLKMAQAIMEE
jgi:hypothetical protein